MEKILPTHGGVSRWRGRPRRGYELPYHAAGSPTRRLPLPTVRDGISMGCPGAERHPCGGRITGGRLREKEGTKGQRKRRAGRRRTEAILEDGVGALGRPGLATAAGCWGWEMEMVGVGSSSSGKRRGGGKVDVGDSGGEEDAEVAETTGASVVDDKNATAVLSIASESMSSRSRSRSRSRSMPRSG